MLFKYKIAGSGSLDYLRTQLADVRLESIRGVAKNDYWGAILSSSSKDKLDSNQCKERLEELFNAGPEMTIRGFGFGVKYSNILFRHVEILGWNRFDISFDQYRSRIGVGGIPRRRQSKIKLTFAGKRISSLDSLSPDSVHQV